MRCLNIQNTNTANVVNTKTNFSLSFNTITKIINFSITYYIFNKDT